MHIIIIIIHGLLRRRRRVPAARSSATASLPARLFRLLDDGVKVTIESPERLILRLHKRMIKSPPGTSTQTNKTGDEKRERKREKERELLHEAQTNKLTWRPRSPTRRPRRRRPRRLGQSRTRCSFPYSFYVFVKGSKKFKNSSRDRETVARVLSLSEFLAAFFCKNDFDDTPTTIGYDTDDDDDDESVFTFIIIIAR